MNTLYLIRHGKTIENSNYTIQGRTEGRLSIEGMQKNEELALQLSSIHFDAIVSSPMQRAQRTAECLASKQEVSVDVLSDLIEWDMGELEGVRYDKDFVLKDQIHLTEGIQSASHRVKQFMNYVQQNYNGATIAVVSHGMTIRTILHLLNQQDFFEIPIVKNSEYKIVCL